MHGGNYMGWPAEMASFQRKQKLHQRFDKKLRAQQAEVQAAAIMYIDNSLSTTETGDHVELLDADDEKIVAE